METWLFFKVFWMTFKFLQSTLNNSRLKVTFKSIHCRSNESFLSQKGMFKAQTRIINTWYDDIQVLINKYIWKQKWCTNMTLAAICICYNQILTVFFITCFCSLYGSCLTRGTSNSLYIRTKEWSRKAQSPLETENKSG